MKRRELIAHLQNHGCVLVREGRRHSWWGNPVSHDQQQPGSVIAVQFRRFLYGSLPKMSVTGIMLWCFEDPAAAWYFVDREKEHLRKMHFWKNITSLSWCVDLKGGALTKHKGLPWIAESVFNTRTFLQSLTQGL